MFTLVVIDGKPYIQGIITTIPTKADKAVCPNCNTPPRYGLDASIGWQRISDDDGAGFSYEADSSPEPSWKGISFDGLPVIVCGNCYHPFTAKPIDDIG